MNRHDPVYTFSTDDCINYWQKKGALWLMFPNTKRADELAGYYCPDKALRHRLMSRLRMRNKRNCARGNHIQGFCDKCAFCDHPMPLEKLVWNHDPDPKFTTFTGEVKS